MFKPSVNKKVKTIDMSKEYNKCLYLLDTSNHLTTLAMETKTYLL